MENNLHFLDLPNTDLSFSLENNKLSFHIFKREDRSYLACFGVTDFCCYFIFRHFNTKSENSKIIFVLRDS